MGERLIGRTETPKKGPASQEKGHVVLSDSVIL